MSGGAGSIEIPYWGETDAFAPYIGLPYIWPPYGDGVESVTKEKVINYLDMMHFDVSTRNVLCNFACLPSNLTW